MENCCINDLGRFPHNEIILTGIISTQDGIHRLNMVSSNGNTFTLKKDLLTGDEISISIGQLNESMKYKFNVVQPDESLLLVDDCDNFTLQTIINTQLDGCSDSCNADSDSGNYYGY